MSALLWDGLRGRQPEPVARDEIIIAPRGLRFGDIRLMLAQAGQQLGEIAGVVGAELRR